MVGIGLGHSLEKNLRKVEVFRQKGQLDRALEKLQEWARKFPDTPHYQFEAAMVAFDLEDWSTGVNALRGLVRTVPDTRDKVLGACRERFDDTPSLALGEFLIDAALVDGDIGSAYELLLHLGVDDRSIHRRKHTMRHQSLVATGNAPAGSLVNSHCLQFLLACTDGDGALAAREATALVGLHDAPRSALDPVLGLAIEEHGELAGFLLARAYLRQAAGAIAESATLAAAAARRDPTHVAEALDLTERADPSDADRGRWLLARGDLEILAGRGERAAQLYLESADADPDLRDALLDRLATASTDDALEERGELLKLRLRLLVVQKRFDDIPPLTQALLRDGAATAQELRALLGEGRAEGLPNEMLVVLAETALRDGDLSAAAVHAHEIPAHDHGSLNRLLRSVEDLLDEWPAGERLQLEALHAVLLARTRNQDAANGRLAGMWTDHAGQFDVLRPVTERCLESVDPTPTLLAAALGVALDHGRAEALEPWLVRLLQTGAGPASGGTAPVFDQDNLDLEFGGGADDDDDRSDDLGASLVAVLEDSPDRAGALLALLDGFGPELGVAHRLRHAVALAALWSGDYTRALPELSVLVMMATPEFVGRVGRQLDVALERDPGQPDLLLMRAELHSDLDEIEDAAATLSRVLAADPSRAEELTRRFDTLRGKASPEQAPDLWRSFAESLFAAGRFDQLGEVCRQALEELPNERTAPFLELQARTMLEEGRLSDTLQFVQKQMVGGRIPAERAVGILDEVLQTHPASPIAHLMLGQAAARAGDMGRAIDGYLGAVRLDDSLAAPVGEQIHKITSHPGIGGSHLVRMAHFQREHGDHAAAAALLDKALNMEPALADRVLGELRDELDRDEGSVDLLVVAAHAARRTGDVERACETLVRIDARDPARFEIVLAEFRKLRETYPDRLLPVLCMGRVLIGHGAPEAAAQTVSDASADGSFGLDERVEMLREFHRRLPDDPALSLALGARLGEQGQHDAAVERVRAAMDLSGFDVDRAVEVTRAVLDREPTHPGLRLLQHDLVLAAGRVGDALRVLPDPASLGDWQQHEISERLGSHRELVIADPELASVYARSLGAQGRTEEAIAVLTEAAERTGSGSGHPIWTELAAALHDNDDREASRRVLLDQARDEGERRLAYQRYAAWSVHRVEGELQALEERHRARPDAAHVALDYAELLLEQGRPSDVPGVLDRTPPTDEWKVRRAVLIGRAHLAMNRADRARAVLSAAAPLAGDDEPGRELLFRLSECEERLGRPAAATARLEQLLDDEIFASRATPRVQRTYGQYLEDVAGTRRAVLTRVSSL